MSISGLINYNEEVAAHYLELLLGKRQDICSCHYCRLDMLAYACNRIDPRYIVSERGHTHAYIDRQSRQTQEDIMAIVNEAVAIVSARSRNIHGSTGNPDLPAGDEGRHKGAAEGRAGADAPADGRSAVSAPHGFFNFPHLVGRVKDALTMGIVEGVLVTAYLDGKKAWLADDTWSNPYFTRKAADGAFSFWFAPEAATAPATREFTVRITFDHDMYQPEERVFNLSLDPEAQAFRYIRENHLYIVPAVNLERRLP